jgi:hypothetical protein
MEVKEKFGLEIQAALPLFQWHMQLTTMTLYFKDAAVHGANAILPYINDLIEIIKYCECSRAKMVGHWYQWPAGTWGWHGCKACISWLCLHIRHKNFKPTCAMNATPTNSVLTTHFLKWTSNHMKDLTKD